MNHEHTFGYRAAKQPDLQNRSARRPAQPGMSAPYRKPAAQFQEHGLLASVVCTAALLTACGGSSGSDPAVDATPSTVDQRISVIDGPIQGAVVCLDANNNGACDAGETRGTTAADGSVTLGVPAADAGKYTVLALVGTDAVDADNGPVATAYSLRAPADKPAVVSPLTTLVAAHAEASGTSSDEAAKLLAEALGLTASLFADFSKATDDAGKLAATIARTVVVATQQQLAATAEAKDKDGKPLSASDRMLVIHQAMLSNLADLARAAAAPAVANAGNVQARAEAIAAAATTLNANSGITKDTVAAAVVAAKLPPTPDATNATPVAGASLRWFSYTDTQNYYFRQFKTTAAHATVVNGKRQFTEYREQSRGSGGNVTGYQQWGDGLNNWARNQVVWTGTEWFDCPTDMVHEATPWDANGVSNSLYCKAYKTTNKRAARDIAGVKMADLVTEIRAYALADTEGSFKAWGPDPVLNADKLSGNFPAGSVLYYYTGTDTGQPDRYNTTLNSDLYIPYNNAVANGVKAECDKVTSSNFAQFQTTAQTLEDLVAATPGKPCVYQTNASTGEANEWWSQSTINIADVADAFVSSSGNFKSGVRDLRVSFASGNVANYWLCLRRSSDNSVRNCSAAGNGSYTIETLGNARVLRLAGEPKVAGTLSFVRTMVERDGKVWYGSRGRLTTSRQLRINGTASDALFAALGLPTPRASAPLTASSLVASYLGTAGPGTVNRNAVAWMENNYANLTGAWALGSATDPKAQVFFFFANGDYVLADPQGDTAPSRCGGAGYERGTFSFDAAAGTLRALTNSLDTNGCAGLHDLPTTSEPFANVPGVLRLSADGQRITATWSDGSGTDTLYRLTR